MRHDTTTRRPAAVNTATPVRGYLVVLTEHGTRGLIDSNGSTYVSSPQSEQQARCLIALLAGVGADMTAGGPWRTPAAGGQRIIELEQLR